MDANDFEMLKYKLPESRLSEEQINNAKAVIRNFLVGSSNIVEYMDALGVAIDALGSQCKIPDIDRWANER